jgi:hypothetical protein
MTVFNPYSREEGLILYAHEVEADDALHMPDKNDGIDDKAPFSNGFDRTSIGRAIGALFLITGLSCVFIVLPVLTFTTNLLSPSRHGKFTLDNPSKFILLIILIG